MFHTKKGESPRLLLLSGTHGDEYGVIESLKKSVLLHSAQLPSYIFVPEVSPSAVAQKTRKNSEGFDINRYFTQHSPSKEVQEAIDFLSQFRFDVLLNFHEDYERKQSSYIYDSHHFSDEEYERWITFNEQASLPLFTGIDDESDPALSNYIQDGYLGTKDEHRTYDSGFFQDWALTNNVVKRSFIIEVPGAAPQAEKDRITAALFSFFLQHYL